jgi:hypothetical protein
MEHLQAVSALVLPSIASYDRLVDGAWAVPLYRDELTHRAGHTSPGG